MGIVFNRRKTGAYINVLKARKLISLQRVMKKLTPRSSRILKNLGFSVNPLAIKSRRRK